MIRDRYDPVQLFDLVPQLQFQFEPELAELDRLLDDDVLFQQVKADLAQRFPKSLVTGRLSTPVEVILRMLIIKHLHGWSAAATMGKRGWNGGSAWASLRTTSAPSAESSPGGAPPERAGRRG